MDILLLEGGGIGPEIAAAPIRLMAQVNDGFASDLKFLSMPIGFAALEKTGTTLPPETAFMPIAPCSWAAGAIGSP